MKYPMTAVFAILAVMGLLALTFCGRAHAHDMAAMSDPERDAWFRSLAVPYAPGRTSYSCCDLRDGHHIDLDHVRERSALWFVDLGKGFVTVPPDRVVKTPKTIDGEAYIFLMSAPTPDSPNGIRCFVPPNPGF